MIWATNGQMLSIRIKFVSVQCPLSCFAAVPWFSLGCTEGSCAQISPNFKTNLEFLVGTLASEIALRPVLDGL